MLTADAQEAYDNARRMLEKGKDVSPETRAKAEELLNTARSDLALVKRGNGVHNFMYAIELLDSVTKRCQQAMSTLRTAKPAQPKAGSAPTPKEKPTPPEKSPKR